LRRGRGEREEREERERYMKCRENICSGRGKEEYRLAIE
jgi:hypothetical protein